MQTRAFLAELRGSCFARDWKVVVLLQYDRFLLVLAVSA